MFFRTLLLWVVGIPITMALFVLVLLSALVDRRGVLVHSIGAFWCRIVLALSGVKVSVTGAGSLPTDRPVIILSNHQGAFDIPVLQGYLPLQYRWLAKTSLFKIPVIGWTMWLAGYIGIERESATKAFKSLRRAAEKVKDGTSVLAFPEGTRSETGELLPFKKGVALLVSMSGVDVVPVAVKGTAGVMRRGSYSVTPARVTLKIGEPFSTGGMKAKDINKRAREAIAALLG
jgi:1-acyl-sn-glycerol-3-phosphate acyltransferase